MPSVVRRARPADSAAIRELIASRPLDPSASGHNGGILVIPSPERMAHAIAHDIVIITERDGQLQAVAMVMASPTFRATEFWELRHGLTHPDLRGRPIDDLEVAYFELLVGAEDLSDRRPLVRTSYEAMWAASSDHDFFVAVTITDPVVNDAGRRLLIATGFTEVGVVQFAIDDLMTTSRVYGLGLERFYETVVAPEASGFITGVLGTTRATLPPFRCGPGAWRGETLAADPSEWTLQLGDEQVAELVEVVNAAVSTPDDLLALTADQIPLPLLSSLLADIGKDLVSGRGFVLLRGLPVDRLSPLERAGCFYAIGVHLGNPRMQNAAGDLLGHVRDVGLATTDPNVRIYQTNDRQTFHTDSCDVVGLCCLQPAKEGGESLLVSALTIYNEMVAYTPELAAELFRPIATDRRGEIPAGEKPYFEIPPLTWFENHLSVLYQRQYIDSAQRFDDVGPLPPEVVEALDRFDELANDPALTLRMNLEPGDMQFVNNHMLLHDRAGFTDWDDPDRKRHLLRLWLSMPGDRPLDPVYRQRYGSVEVGNRGGIAVAGAQPTVSI